MDLEIVVCRWPADQDGKALRCGPAEAKKILARWRARLKTPAGREWLASRPPTAPGGLTPRAGKTGAQEWQEFVEDWIVRAFGESRLSDELYDLGLEFGPPFYLFITTKDDDRLYFVEELFDALESVGVLDEPFRLPRE